MASSMISPTKLHIHIRTLIYAGLKVGVVKQMETRALKAVSSNASKPFTRQVTAVYTASTWVDDMSFEESASPSSSSSSGRRGSSPTTSHHSLMSIVEREGEDDPEKTRIGIVANFVSTGDIVWDEFDDAALRSELDTRLSHLSPVELLLPQRLTRRTEQVLKHYASRGTPDGQFVRVERIQMRDYNTALTLANETMQSGDMQESQSGEAAAVLHALPRLTMQGLAASMEHLRSFGLTALFQRSFRVRSFANRTAMLLTSGTLANLEVLESSAQGLTKNARSRGSLLWLVDRCRSGMGKRRLREWLSRPLCDPLELEARADAVQEVADKIGSSSTLSKALDLLTGQPDLEKGLARVSYGRAGPAELARVLLALHRVATQFTFTSPADVPLSSTILKESIFMLSKPVQVLAEAMKAIHMPAAMSSDKIHLFDLDHTPAVMHDIGEEMRETHASLRANERDFDDHLEELRKELKRPGLQYTSVAEKEFLIEVLKANANRVPSSWSRINATTKVVRFQTPRILNLLRVRDQLKETLADQASAAYALFVTDLTGNAEAFVALRDSVQALAQLDALASLARLASLPGWSRPTIAPSTAEQHSTLRLQNFRHPMSEALLDRDYVPNTIALGGGSGASDAEEGEGTKAVLITGSNMGGKSSTVRAMALCVLLAQVGAAVPATGAEISLFDSILTRMGASDDLAAGRSTFQTELEETGEVLRTATSRSLVVLDELGRGTSTHDGMAIAYATLKYLMCLPRDRCPMTLFITHYFSLGRLQDDPETFGRVRNMHMAYHVVRPAEKVPGGDTGSTSGRQMEEAKTESEDKGMDGDGDGDEYCLGSQLLFLYKLRAGLASSSFGIHCAAAAGLPMPLLALAQRMARQMQTQSAGRERRQHAVDALRQIHSQLA